MSIELDGENVDFGIYFLWRCYVIRWAVARDEENPIWWNRIND